MRRSGALRNKLLSSMLCIRSVTMTPTVCVVAAGLTMLMLLAHSGHMLLGHTSTALRHTVSHTSRVTPRQLGQARLTMRDTHASSQMHVLLHDLPGVEATTGLGGDPLRPLPDPPQGPLQPSAPTLFTAAAGSARHAGVPTPQDQSGTYRLYNDSSTAPDTSYRCLRAHICEDQPYCDLDPLGCVTEAPQRQHWVQQAMLDSFTAYRRTAWGHDEMATHPTLAQPAIDWMWLGLSIVDSLDTLWLMGLREQYQEARNWVVHSMDLAAPQEPISVFETNIRVVGGLLATFALTGDTALLHKARDVADRLLPAFATHTGVPHVFWDVTEPPSLLHRLRLLTGLPLDAWQHPPPAPQVGRTNMAASTTFILEWSALSRYTGDLRYERAARRFWHHLHRMPSCSGLYCTWFDAETLQCDGDEWELGFGASGDSFYEYQLKQWVQSGGRDVEMLHMYQAAVRGMREQLIMEVRPSEGFITEAPAPQAATPVSVASALHEGPAAQAPTAPGQRSMWSEPFWLLGFGTHSASTSRQCPYSPASSSSSTIGTRVQDSEGVAWAATDTPTTSVLEQDGMQAHAARSTAEGSSSKVRLRGTQASGQSLSHTSTRRLHQLGAAGGGAPAGLKVQSQLAQDIAGSAAAAVLAAHTAAASVAGNQAREQIVVQAQQSSTLEPALQVDTINATLDMAEKAGLGKEGQGVAAAWSAAPQTEPLGGLRRGHRRHTTEPVTPQLRLQHFTCFAPGMLVLGHLYGLNTASPADAKLEQSQAAAPTAQPLLLANDGTPVVGPSQPPIVRPPEARSVDDLMLAAKLMRGCYDMYRSTATGVSGDVVDWQPTAQGGLHEALWENTKSFLRPEVVESLFYLWQATRDPVYREWGWQIFRAHHQFSRLKTGGYSTLEYAVTEFAEPGDRQESFWMAETLKYLYLLFNDNETLVPLSEWVFNTEAHPLPLWGSSVDTRLLQQLKLEPK